jgi:hypothetical protein
MKAPYLSTFVVLLRDVWQKVEQILRTSVVVFTYSCSMLRWKETQWNTNQQAVHSQVSAMNAATAQMVSQHVFQFQNVGNKYYFPRSVRILNDNDKKVVPEFF